MAISIEALHAMAKRRCGGGGSVFDDLFVSAVNRVSREVKDYLDLDVDDIEATSGELDIDSKYLGIYEEGVVYFLFKSGEWGKKPDSSQEADYRRQIALGQTKALEDAEPTVGYPPGEWT